MEFQLTKSEYDAIVKMASKKKDGVEFEVRFQNPAIRGQENFNRILNRLIFSEKNGGRGLEHVIETSLDIKLGEARVSILGTDSIKKFFLSQEAILADDTDIKYVVIKKGRDESFVLKEYDVKFSLAQEKPIEGAAAKSILTDVVKITTEKFYRYKTRYAVALDPSVRADLTITKEAFGKDLKYTDILQKNMKYEIELELTGPLTKAEGVEPSAKPSVEPLIEHICFILSSVHQWNGIMTKSEMGAVRAEYEKLVKSDKFIAANPVTLLMEHLKPGTGPSILNKYALSLKADGTRMFLFTSAGGAATLMDNNFGMIPLIDAKGLAPGCLLEGEYIRANNSFYAYDMLFWNGKDIRRSYLNASKKSSGERSRMSYLTDSVAALRVQNVVIKLKENTYSKHAEGKDIFQLAARVWRARDTLDFPVDGIIFTPMLQSYPGHAGAWHHLFKWKPPEYNSIDFLVKFERDEDGALLKRSVMFEPKTMSGALDAAYFKEIGIDTVNAASEFAIQYYTLELYVGRYPKQAKPHPTPFNPTDGDEFAYSTALVPIAPDGSAYTVDPLNNERHRIFDGTIVEFVVETRHTLFPWKPIRNRELKTEQYRAGEHQYGNAENVANDIWFNIIEPITEEMLGTGKIVEGRVQAKTTSYYAVAKQKGPRLAIQNFHTTIVKNRLIQSVRVATALANAPEPTGSKKSAAAAETKGLLGRLMATGSNGGVATLEGDLLELGVGRGGDYNRWIGAKFQNIVGIDVDRDGIEVAKKRYAEAVAGADAKPNVLYIWGDSKRLMFPNYDIALNEENRKLLSEKVVAKWMFDVVSIQFAAHYFFESELTLRTLMHNVSDNLRIGGHFIGTCFDGGRIYAALKGKTEIVGKTDDGTVIWRIEKKYKMKDFEAGRKSLGHMISQFFITIGQTHDEPIVNFKYFEEVAGEYGLKLISLKPFSEYYDELTKESNKNLIKGAAMSDVEKELSFFNSSFTFQKTQNYPDKRHQLLQKLEAKAATEPKAIKKEKKKVVSEEAAPPSADLLLNVAGEKTIVVNAPDVEAKRKK